MKKALVIDDDIIQQTILSRFLQRYDLAVDTASGGYEGWQKAIALLPDFMLIDYRLGDMDGIALLKLIKQDERLQSIPVVIITADLSDEPRIQAMQEGAFTVLIKPIDQSKIERLYRQLMDTLAA